MYEQFSIKHRPKVLSDVFGQDNIVKQLTNRARKKEWPKAILLKGPFGTGKTTVAQIIAASIQCTHIDNEGNPCGSCPSCSSIFSETFSRDTIRLDGGSSGKKDDVTELLSVVNVRPMYDKARIFIIEEADQLSTAAMNALLKIAEAPTGNIYFLFLSMEQGGVTGALQSRCQTFYFKNVGTKDTMFALRKILIGENLWDGLPKEFKLEGLSAIAENSKGSLREAVNILENCLQGEFFTAKEIQENLGIMSEAVAYQIMQGLLDKSKDESLWSSIFKIDPMELYNYLTSVISGAMVFKQTGYIPDESKIESTKRIANSLGFDSMFEILTSYQGFSRPYIRRSDILSALALYYQKTSRITEAIPTREPIATRPVRQKV